MTRLLSIFAFLTLVFGAIGCGPPVREEIIEVKASNDPLNEPRSILKRYSEGQAIGSEVMSFPKLVQDVKAVDPNRGQILETGLADLQKAAPTARAAMAKDLLTKLQPSPK